MQVGSLILVSMIRPSQLKNTFRRKRLEWPLHVTLIPWFTTDEQATIRKLETFLSGVSPFNITFGEDAQFGANQDIAVSLVTDQTRIAEFHKQLMSVLVNDVVFAEQRWVGDGYVAHSTHHGSERLHPGDVHTVDTVTVVRLLEHDVCEVVKNISLVGVTQ